MGLAAGSRHLPRQCFTSSCVLLTELLRHQIVMLKSSGIQKLQPCLWACSVSDAESDSASSSSDEFNLSNGHTAAELDWDNLGFGLDHLAPVSFTRLDMPDMH